ncbi:MAG TPA: F0F1 ATP synthase subunit delta [Verrucomicrobiae bacterium]|jgi:F0F1-type ATP synthase delta subunit|nr:F0F1 ATP synthase subunit delta [Verrucomicrobiae bacterium]
MPFVGTFLFLLIFCGGLLFIMNRVLNTQAHQVTRQLMTISEEQDKKITELQKQAKDNELKAAQLINEARQEAERVKKEAREKADMILDQMQQQGRTEAEHIVSEAVKTRDAMRQEMVQQMEKKVVVRACQVVLEILSAEARKSAHEQMLCQLMEGGLQTLEKMDSREKIARVRIVSAFPLESGLRAKIEETVQKKLGHLPEIAEVVDEKLVAGLRIELGHLVLEGSLASRVKEYLKNAA